MYKYVTHSLGCLLNASFTFTKKHERTPYTVRLLIYFITPPELFNTFYWSSIAGESPATSYCKAEEERTIAVSVSAVRCYTRSS